MKRLTVKTKKNFYNGVDKKMKEKLIEIGQEKIDKAINEFESRAMSSLIFLTERFKSDFSEDVDRYLNGYLADVEKIKKIMSSIEKDNAKLVIEKTNLEMKKKQLESVRRWLERENEELRNNWNELCNYLGNEIANNNECEKDCMSSFLNKVNEIGKYDGSLEIKQQKLAIEKLEELKYYNHPTNTRCLPSCWVIDKVEKMIKDLKGGAENE